MALAGWNTSQMLEGIAPVLDLAASSNIDLAKASDIVTDYLTAFGLQASDTTHFVDMMSYAMAHSNTDTEMLAEAYKNCAATASSLGYSSEETTAVLMTMANAGVKGGEAGTGLSTIMTRLATNTSECADKLEEYGVKVYDSKGNMNSLSSILEGVSKMWTTLTDEQQANIAKTIAGTNHFSKLQTIMAGLSDTAKAGGMSFTDYASALQDCDGTAQKMADTMLDNLSGDMTILESAVDGVKLSLSEKLNPAIREVIQYVTEKVPDLEDVLADGFESASDKISWLVEHMPQIISTMKKVAPVITSVGTAFLTWQSLQKINSFVLALPDKIHAIWAVLSANPLVAVTAALTALTAGVALYISTCEQELTVGEQITKAHQEQYDALEKNRKQLNELNGSFKESAKQADNEARSTEYLWKQLDKVCDSSGNVKEADRIRAEYIAGELSKAIGQEISLVDGQIQGYKLLSDEIDNIIAKKKAEAYLDSYLAGMDEATQVKNSAQEQYRQAAAERDASIKAMGEAETALNESLKGSSWEGFSADDIIKSYNSKAYGVYITDEQYNAAKAYDYAMQKYQESNARFNQSKAEYNEAVDYLDRYDKAFNAFLSGEYEEVEKFLYSHKDNLTDALATAESIDGELKAEFDTAMQDFAYDLKLAFGSESQNEIDEVLQKFGEIAMLGLKSGASEDEVFTKDMFQKIKELTDNKYDISKLSEWAAESGVDIGWVFTENWQEVVQSQFAEGYDVTKLVLWAERSGRDVSDCFSEEFGKQVESHLDVGFKVDGLFNWAIENGRTLGDLLGENMSSVANQYLYATNDLIPKSIQSPSDARLYATGKYDLGSLTKYATGGYISSGNSAIVGESGEELLRVMNGGVVVTPMRNSGGSGGSQSSTVNNYFSYSFGDVKLASNMDIRTVAQQLAAEKSRHAAGRGLK